MTTTETTPATPLHGALAGLRVLVIGGAGGGNGQAISEAAAQAGAAAVGVVDLVPERAEEVRATIAATGVHAAAIAGDVRDPADVERIVATAVAELGGIDVLLTVVGGYSRFTTFQPLHETTDDVWQLILDVNLTYVFRMVRAVLPHFLAQGGGSIVSVGSIAGSLSSPMSSAYGASKAGLLSLCRSVAAEYGRRGVRMNVVNCGPIATAIIREKKPSDNTGSVPLGRSGTPEEVANAVVFLASPLSSYTSGTAIDVDGGTSAHFPLALPGTDRSMAG